MATSLVPQLRRHDKSRLRFRSGAGGRSLGQGAEGGAGGLGDRLSATEASPMDNLRREVRRAGVFWCGSADWGHAVTLLLVGGVSAGMLSPPPLLLWQVGGARG